jgi:hypothetical protein
LGTDIAPAGPKLLVREIIHMKEHPFPLKPMSVGSILDYSFRTYRNNFKSILVFSALISGLFSMLLLVITNAAAPKGVVTDPMSLIIRGIKSGNFQSILDNYLYNVPQVEAGPGYLLKTMLLMAVTYGGAFINSVFITRFVRGGITNISSKYFHGFKQDVKVSLKEAWKQLGQLILTGLSLTVCYMGFGTVSAIFMIVLIPVIIISSANAARGGPTGGAIALIVIVFILIILLILVIGAVFSTLIAFVYPVAVTEKRYHFNAVGRSFKLAWKKFWKVFGVNILVYILVYIVIGAISGLAFLAALISPVDIMFQQVITLLITALVTPITHIASTILYYDVRMRVEGYDIELMSQNLEGVNPWGQPEH